MRQKMFITALLISTSVVAASHAAELRTIAITGQSAPGTPGDVEFESFGSYYTGGLIPVFQGPVLNDAGQTAFRANLNGSGVDSTNNQGVWSEGSGSLALVARTGSQAPGAPSGTNFAADPEIELFTPVLNGAGQTAFYGAIADGRWGLWSEGGGSLAMVAADGVHAPVLPNGVSFSVNYIGFLDVPLLNDAGQTAFGAGLAGGGVNGSNDTGAWSAVDLNSLALLASKGNQAAGAPAGVRYAIAQGPFSLNNAGQAAVFSWLAGSGVDGSNDRGLWLGNAGSLAMVARAGSPAEGTSSGVNYRDLFAQTAINNAGQFAFEAWLTGGDVVNNLNDEGLWSNASGNLQLVARRGSQAAGAPVGVAYGLFSLSSNPLLNDAGQLAFHAGLEGDGVDASNNEGIWLGKPGELALVARRGQHAANAPNGVTFSELHLPTLNSAGQIAFRANVAGDGVDVTNDRGIWATNLGGVLELIARAGDMLEVSPGDFRTLTAVDFVTATGNGDSRPSAFNNRGQLAFWASFSDGSQGVFVSNKVAHIPGDFDGDGTVDAADLAQWQGDFGTNGDSDADNDGDSDGADFLTWQRQLGSHPSGDFIAAVPEPPALSLLLILLTGLATCVRPPDLPPFRPHK